MNKKWYVPKQKGSLLNTPQSLPRISEAKSIYKVKDYRKAMKINNKYQALARKQPYSLDPLVALRQKYKKKMNKFGISYAGSIRGKSLSTIDSTTSRLSVAKKPKIKDKWYQQPSPSVKVSIGADSESQRYGKRSRSNMKLNKSINYPIDSPSNLDVLSSSIDYSADPIQVSESDLKIHSQFYSFAIDPVVNFKHRRNKSQIKHYNRHLKG